MWRKKEEEKNICCQWEAGMWSGDLRANERPQKTLHKKETEHRQTSRLYEIFGLRADSLKIIKNSHRHRRWISSGSIVDKKLCSSHLHKKIGFLFSFFFDETKISIEQIPKTLPFPVFEMKPLRLPYLTIDRIILSYINMHKPLLLSRLNNFHILR